MSAEQVQGATIGATAEAAGKTLSTANVAGGPLTFGQKAVGLTFNPSGDAKVNVLKAQIAGFIDSCNDWRTEATNPEVKRMYSIAITEAQGAQMWAVKSATWRE